MLALYEERERTVIAGAARRAWMKLGNPAPTSHDLEDAVEAAFTTAWSTPPELADEGAVRAWLITATWRAHAHELRKRTGARKAGKILAASEQVQPAPELDEEHVVQEQIEVFMGALSDRQRAVYGLYWGAGLTQPQVAERLGCTRAQVKKWLEKGMSRLRRCAVAMVREHQFDGEDGFCGFDRDSLVDHALGRLEPSVDAVVSDHVGACPVCTAVEARVHALRKGAAAAIPLPLLATPSGGGGLIDRATELLSGVKQGAVSTTNRVSPDPGVSQVASAGGLRGSGGAVAAMVGCLALGGGATYCLVNGVPLPGLARASGEHHAHREGARPHINTRLEAQRGAATATAAIKPKRAAKPRSSRSAATTAPASAAQAPGRPQSQQGFFGSGGSGSTGGPAPSVPKSTPNQSGGASGGGGEFF